MSDLFSHQFALIRRELWENRSIWITPAAIALVVTFGMIALVIMAAAFGETINPEIEKIADATIPDAIRRAALAGFLLFNTSIFVLAMWFVIVFYCIDALYAERKDKSILFWRSLPITDAETVVSKLLTAAIAIPVATMAAIVISNLINLIIISFWVGAEGVSPLRFIWAAVPLFDTWSAVFIYLLAIPVWLAPLLGWFLFVSAYVKSGKFLSAVLPIAIVPTLEFISFRTWNLGWAILDRLALDKMPIYDITAFASGFDEDDLHSLLEQDISLISLLDVSGFLTSVEVWAGLIVCGLFVTAAIYVRRYRDES